MQLNSNNCPSLPSNLFVPLFLFFSATWKKFQVHKFLGSEDLIRPQDLISDLMPPCLYTSFPLLNNLPFFLPS